MLRTCGHVTGTNHVIFHVTSYFLFSYYFWVWSLSQGPVNLHVQNILNQQMFGIDVDEWKKEVIIYQHHLGGYSSWTPHTDGATKYYSLGNIWKSVQMFPKIYVAGCLSQTWPSRVGAARDGQDCIQTSCLVRNYAAIYFGLSRLRCSCRPVNINQ